LIPWFPREKLCAEIAAVETGARIAAVETGMLSIVCGTGCYEDEHIIRELLLFPGEVEAAWSAAAD